MTTPHQQPDAFDDADRGMPTATDDQCCDLCCAVPVVTELDGDRMCRDCADKWVRNERPDDDLVPLDHPLMREALADWNKLYEGHRAYQRQVAA